MHPTYAWLSTAPEYCKVLVIQMDVNVRNRIGMILRWFSTRRQMSRDILLSKLNRFLIRSSQELVRQKEKSLRAIKVA